MAVAINGSTVAGKGRPAPSRSAARHAARLRTRLLAPVGVIQDGCGLTHRVVTAGRFLLRQQVTGARFDPLRLGFAVGCRLTCGGGAR
ncbi:MULTISPECIES: hypothetical protein [unclassified Micromonospora]|uniref:hypothetical protein n=1 Tax=unclassified Micromonospora TaxID=2617518 RepID=UPI003A89A0BF